MVQQISRKKRNGVRLQLYRDKIDDRLLTKFHEFFPRDGHELCQEFKKREAELKKLRKVLSRAQYILLLPKSGFVDSTQFDTTLLIFLLRNFCLQEPASGWGADPEEDDWSDEANAERFRKGRNWIQHNKVKVSNKKFKEITDFLHKPLLCYGCSEEELKNLKTCILDTRLLSVLRNEFRSKRCRYGVFQPIANHLNRNEFITKIHTELNNCVGRHCGLVISGLGGVGKSELSRKYCQAFDEEYNTVLWVNSDSITSIVQSFQNIYEMVFASEEIPSNEALIVQAVYQFFSESSVLIVFDGVDDYNFITKFLPPTNSVHVIVTSQNTNLPVGFSSVSLSVFEKEQAFEFLKTNIPETCRYDPESLTSIIEFLQSHPLALQQAVSYIKQNVISTADYAKLLETNAPDLLNHSIIDAGQHSVMKTFTLAINKLKNCLDNASTIKVLDLICYLDGKTIKRGLIYDFLEGDMLETNKALRVLKSYSLINIQDDQMDDEYQDQVVTIHSLVQIAVRVEQSNRQDSGQDKKAIEAAIYTIFQYNTEDAVFYKLKHLCDHIIYMLHQRHIKSRLLEYVISNQTFIVELFKIRAMYKELQSIFEQAKQHLLVLYAEGNEEIVNKRTIQDLIIDINYNISLILSQKNEHRVAFEILQSVRSYLQKANDESGTQENQRKLLLTESSIASCLLDQKNFKDALRIFQQIHREEMELYSEDDPTLLQTHSNIAFCLMNTKKYNKALKIFRHIEEQKKKIYTRENDPAIIPTQINIACCLLKKQDYNEALQLLRRIEACQRVIYDNDHPELSNTRNGILRCQTRMKVLKEKTITCTIM